MRFSSAFATVTSLAAIGAVSLVASPAHAQITGLFNTGVVTNGNPLAVGSTDTHYSFITGGTTPSVAPAVVTNNNAYVQSPSSAYIFNNASGSAVGTYTLRTTFTIVSGTLSTAQVTGAYSVDNILTSVLINGTSTGISSSGSGSFGAFTPFTISTGFVTGTNTLDFVVNNVDGPGALNVTNLVGTIGGTATAAPEPGSLALLIPAGLGVVGMVRRRRN